MADGVLLLSSLTLSPGDTWISGYLRRADENRDGKMSYDEVKRLLQMINIDLNEQYARSLFKVSVWEESGGRGELTQKAVGSIVEKWQLWPVELFLSFGTSLEKSLF